MMLDVIIALFPALIWGVYVFGFRALIITLVSVISAVLSETLFELNTGRKITATDLSAVVTGMLLAFCLPVSVPLYVPALGSAFAIIIVKMIFGGIGKNFMNPALGGAAFLTIAFPQYMTRFTKPFEKISAFAINVSDKEISGIIDSISLTELKTGDSLSSNKVTELLIGRVCGNIGEISAAMLLLGLVYLLIKRVVSVHIPVSFALTVFLIGFFFPRASAEPITVSLYELLSGSVILISCFMATDQVTSPLTPYGKIIFGVGCGALTMLIRSYGAFNEGAVFAVLIMNVFVYFIDKLTAPAVFGGGRR